MSRNVLIIAGEPSGDIRGGELLKELKALLPDISLWGIGGDSMEGEGAELIEHVRNLSIIGVWEAIRSLGKIRNQYKNVTKNILKRKPDLAILIDYPGFNLKVAKFLHKKNIPVIYYVVPQVWAWGPERAKLLKRYVNKALTLFKFEEEFLQKAGVNCKFVGHPLVDTLQPYTKKLESPGPQTTNYKLQTVNTIALLPGSRKSEIENLFPLMLDTARRLNNELKDLKFIVAKNSNIDDALYETPLSKHADLSVLSVTDDTPEALSRSDFAIVTSGTATLEAAIMEKPLIITYVVAPLTAILYRLFIKVPFIGLVNIIAGKEIAPEVTQENATAQKLSKKVLEIISDDSRMQTMRDELRKVKCALGEPGASKRAALAISNFLSKNT